MALHQTLKKLCSKSGWCYAVFWKLKRRSRMVLTWEDGYYEFQSLDTGGSTSCLETGGNPLRQRGALQDTSYSHGQIGLAVAKMSYCVYFMGEGIIGRVASTGKHQWVFADGDISTLGAAFGNASNNQCMLEKYPSSWEVQFAAGIKTIAVIAVPQGVVQLGSTRAMLEDVEWIDHVKSAFGAIQSFPGTIALSEGQEGRSVISPPGMPSGNLSEKVCKANLNQPSLRGIVDVPNVGLQSLVYGLNGRSCASARSNLQKSSAVESSQILPQKGETLQVLDVKMGSTRLRPSVLNSNSQTFESFSTASSLGSLSNQQALLPCEDIRGVSCSGDLRSTLLSSGNVQSSLVDTFARGQGPCAETDTLSSLYEQSNKTILAQSRILDTGSHLPSVPVNEQSLQQAKGTSPSGLYASSNFGTSDLSGMVGSIGDVATSSQDILSSFGVKSCGNQEFLVDSMVGVPSQRMSSEEGIHKRYSADSMCFSEGAGDKNFNSRGADSFEIFLASVTEGQSSKWDCSFAIGDELSQALGPCFRQSRPKRDNPLDKDQSKVGVDRHSTSSLSGISAAELTPAWGSNFVKSEPLFPEGKSEPLLDAIVASASSSHLSVSTAADDSFSCRTFSAKDTELSVPKIAETPTLKHASSHSTQDCMSQSFMHGGPVVCEASANNQALSKVFNDPLGFNTSSTVSPLKTILSSWTEDMQSTRSNSTQSSQLKKPEDPAKATRKRARPGESTRPRPKDRQQIQDRVRELREIVPNGSKCSIDALLEKTIKHMLFLQNVTLHADNLKKNGELKDDVESGASWALELGGEDTGRPPILVKNLNQPRQLLVEMFCEEKGHFLEIADMIRSLGLTILKGVMESRSDKIWARFVVEANRDVQRLNIMMSLMHLPHLKNISSSSMTMGSQTAPLSSQQGVDCSSSSQAHAQTLTGFSQPSLRA